MKNVIPILFLGVLLTLFALKVYESQFQKGYQKCQSNCQDLQDQKWGLGYDKGIQVGELLERSRYEKEKESLRKQYHEEGFSEAILVCSLEVERLTEDYEYELQLKDDQLIRQIAWNDSLKYQLQHTHNKLKEAESKIIDLSSSLKKDKTQKSSIISRSPLPRKINDEFIRFFLLLAFIIWATVFVAYKNVKHRRRRIR